MIRATTKEPTKAMFACSGDPIHYGHIDIITRAARVFDEVTVGIGVNADKKPLFTLDERVEMAARSLRHLPNVRVKEFSGLLVNYAYKNGIPTIVKGVRDAEDFRYELTLHSIGESQDWGIDTFLLPSKESTLHISSRAIKELRKLSGKILEYVPMNVKQCLEAKLMGQYIVGITGEPGAGKSYVAKRFVEYGKARGITVHNIELDYLGHEILGNLQEPCYKAARAKIAEEFGKELMRDDGSIDRHILGEIVFSDYAKLERLNEIMRKPLLARLQDELAGKQGIILINAALIAESEMAYLCNNNVAIVSADGASQERRLRGRQLTEGQIERRLNSQYTTAEKARHIAAQIQRYSHGRMWSIENPDGANMDTYADVFSSIVESIGAGRQTCDYMHWQDMCHAINAGANTTSGYDAWLAGYGKRAYHNLDHIDQTLEELRTVRHLAHDYHALEFALRFHDAGEGSEERSAYIAGAVADMMNLPEDFKHKIERYILATDHRNVPSGEQDLELMHDIDLSILGSPSYDTYRQNIREEYSMYPPMRYCEGRIRFLEGMLARPHIYCTEHYRSKYEQSARENIQRELADLRKDPAITQ